VAEDEAVEATAAVGGIKALLSDVMGCLLKRAILFAGFLKVSTYLPSSVNDVKMGLVSGNWPLLPVLFPTFALS